MSILYFLTGCFLCPSEAWIGWMVLCFSSIFLKKVQSHMFDQGCYHQNLWIWSCHSLIIIRTVNVWLCCSEVTDISVRFWSLNYRAVWSGGILTQIFITAYKKSEPEVKQENGIWTEIRLFADCVVRSSTQCWSRQADGKIQMSFVVWLFTGCNSHRK